MKKHTLALFILISAVSFSVFAGGSKEVSALQKEEMRIVSLAPNMTEIVYALGCGDYLVGRTDACNYPEECKNIPVAADMWMPSTESIVALEPTLVLVSSLTDPTCIQAIKDAGINIQQINYEDSLNGTFSLIEDVGKLLGKEKEADEEVNKIRTKIEFIASTVSSIQERKSIIYLISWGDWGDYAATGETFMNDVLEAAGCINAAESGQYWAISKELLLEQDPDYIILPYYSYSSADIDGFNSTEPYNRLTGKVVTINGDRAERQGIRIADAIEEIASIVYPELF